MPTSPNRGPRASWYYHAMKHPASDRARIIDPAVTNPTLTKSTPIAKDEPVFLLRAKDALAPDTLERYAAEAQRAGCDVGFVKGVREQAALMREWQYANNYRLPNFPESDEKRMRGLAD